MRLNFRRQARLQLPGPPARLGSSRAIGGSAARCAAGLIYTATACTFGPAEAVGCLKCAVRAPKSGSGRCMTGARPVREPRAGAALPRSILGRPSHPPAHAQAHPAAAGGRPSHSPRVCPHRWIYTANVMERNPSPSAQRAGRPNSILLFTVLCSHAKDPEAS